MAAVRRYELFVPMEYNADADGNRQPVEEERFDEIETALFEAFGGLTKSSSDAPYRGYWFSSQSGLMTDRIVVYTVMDFRENLDVGERHIRDLKTLLLAMLQQEEILLVYSNLTAI